MKKIFFVTATLLAGAVTNTSLAQQETETGSAPKTLLNGVVIHEAVGVEGVVTETTETPIVQNTVEHWTEDQLHEAMAYIKLKKAENISASENAAYDQQLKALEEKLKQLESNK